MRARNLRRERQRRSRFWGALFLVAVLLVGPWIVLAAVVVSR